MTIGFSPQKSSFIFAGETVQLGVFGRLAVHVPGLLLLLRHFGRADRPHEQDEPLQGLQPAEGLVGREEQAGKKRK